MKPINNWENIKPAGDIQVIPAGGYVCEIKKATEKPNKSGRGTHLEILFDVCEGEYSGFFEVDYRGQNREDKYWHGIIRQNVPDEASTKFDVQAGFFKRLMDDIESSNSGFHWAWDENALKGLKIGVVFGEVERESMRGTRYMTTQASAITTVENVREKKYKLPDPRMLPGSVPASASSAPALDANDLPF